jgi:hypothetical protein
MATWFETRAAKFTQAAYTCLRAALLTMRIWDLILRSGQKGRVSKDEATELKIRWFDFRVRRTA